MLIITSKIISPVHFIQGQDASTQHPCCILPVMHLIMLRDKKKTLNIGSVMEI